MVEKLHKQRNTHYLERTVKQTWFKNLGEPHKTETESRVSASRTAMQDISGEWGIKVSHDLYQVTPETETMSGISELG